MICDWYVIESGGDFFEVYVKFSWNKEVWSFIDYYFEYVFLTKILLWLFYFLFVCAFPLSMSSIDCRVGLVFLVVLSYCSLNIDSCIWKSFNAENWKSFHNTDYIFHRKWYFNDGNKTSGSNVLQSISWWSGKIITLKEKNVAKNAQNKCI